MSSDISDDEELNLDQELGGGGRKQMRYEGEDVSPTTSRELNGWYAYPIAAEVFAVVAVGTLRTFHMHASSFPLPKPPSFQKPPLVERLNGTERDGTE